MDTYEQEYTPKPQKNPPTQMLRMNALLWSLKCRITQKQSG